MLLGSAALAGCVGYILYMRSQVDRRTSYLAEADDGNLYVQPKKSRWDM